MAAGRARGPPNGRDADGRVWGTGTLRLTACKGVRAWTPLQGGAGVYPLVRPAVAEADVMSWACTEKRGKWQNAEWSNEPVGTRGNAPYRT